MTSDMHSPPREASCTQMDRRSSHCMHTDAIWFHVAGSRMHIDAEQRIQWSVIQSDVEWQSARPQHQAVKREDIQTAVKCVGEGWDGRGKWHNGMEL